MPVALGKPFCRGVSPSVPSELAWILNLVIQTARYAVPALAELDANLLPGVKALRAPMMDRIGRLWEDSLPGCPELLLVAHLADCVDDDQPQRLFAWLGGRGDGPTPHYELLTEPAEDRPAVLRRLQRLHEDPAARRAYRGVLVEVWELASTLWEQRGRALAVEACASWRSRLDLGATIEELVPPRHPLTHADRLGFEDLFAHRNEFAVSPLYFCMSGGHVVDLGDYVHVAVPASDLLPVRKVRDAAFVADTLRVLAEPTRVHLLLQLLSAPAGVMEVARLLRVSQPTISEHLRVLREAGLVQPRRFGSRTVFVGSRKRIERLLEDARATIARWD